MKMEMCLGVGCVEGEYNNNNNNNNKRKTEEKAREIKQQKSIIHKW